MEKNQDDPDNLVYVPLLDNHIIIQDEIPIINEDSSSMTTINVFKDQLISTVDKLYDLLDFLKNELEEKNILVRTIIEKNNNNLVKLLHQHLNTQQVETTCSATNTLKSTDNIIASSKDSITDINEYTLIDEVSLLSNGSSSVDDSFVLNSTNHESIEEQITDYKCTDLPQIYRNVSIKDQLKIYREIKHAFYMNQKECNNIDETILSEVSEFNNVIDRGLINCFNNFDISHEVLPRDKPSKFSKPNAKTWPKNTILIASDSILNQIDENRLSKDFNVKVRAFSGATIEDMYYYLHPLLPKEPDYILLHVCTNNSTDDDADEIVNKILCLKSWIEDILPNCTIILSEPTLRFDSPKATRTIKEVIILLNQLDILMMSNSNIEREQIGKRGLHLNDHGVRRVATNIISLIRGL